ncbi:hypothetical protein PCE1_002067 [Barthelona sp. PCE]
MAQNEEICMSDEGSLLLEDEVEDFCQYFSQGFPSLRHGCSLDELRLAFWKEYSEHEESSSKLGFNFTLAAYHVLSNARSRVFYEVDRLEHCLPIDEPMNTGTVLQGLPEEDCNSLTYSFGQCEPTAFLTKLEAGQPVYFGLFFNLLLVFNPQTEAQVESISQCVSSIIALHSWTESNIRQVSLNEYMCVFDNKIFTSENKAHQHLLGNYQDKAKAFVNKLKNYKDFEIDEKLYFFTKVLFSNFQRVKLNETDLNATNNMTLAKKLHLPRLMVPQLLHTIEEMNVHHHKKQRKKKKKGRKQQSAFPLPDSIFSEILSDKHNTKYLQSAILSSDMPNHQKSALRTILNGLYDAPVRIPEIWQPPKEMKGEEEVQEAVESEDIKETPVEEVEKRDSPKKEVKEVKEEPKPALRLDDLDPLTRIHYERNAMPEEERAEDMALQDDVVVDVATEVFNTAIFELFIQPICERSHKKTLSKYMKAKQEEILRHEEEERKRIQEQKRKKKQKQKLMRQLEESVVDMLLQNFLSWEMGITCNEALFEARAKTHSLNPECLEYKSSGGVTADSLLSEELGEYDFDKYDEEAKAKREQRIKELNFDESLSVIDEIFSFEELDRVMRVTKKSKRKPRVLSTIKACRDFVCLNKLPETLECIDHHMNDYTHLNIENNLNDEPEKTKKQEDIANDTNKSVDKQKQRSKEYGFELQCSSANISTHRLTTAVQAVFKTTAFQIESRKGSRTHIVFRDDDIKHEIEGNSAKHYTYTHQDLKFNFVPWKTGQQSERESERERTKALSAPMSPGPLLNSRFKKSSARTSLSFSDTPPGVRRKKK